MKLFLQTVNRQNRERVKSCQISILNKLSKKKLPETRLWITPSPSPFVKLPALNKK